MPGIPIRQLPRAAEPRPFPSMWDGLFGGADQGNDPLTQAIAPAPVPRGRTTDIELLPEVAEPEMFRGVDPSMALRGLESAQAAAVAPDVDPFEEELSAARAGFKADPGIDWASERAGFLAQGNADREAENAGNARMAQNALMPMGRSGEDALRSDVAFRGLQQARSMQDPGYARGQRQLDTLAGAETFADPRMAAMRSTQREEALAGKAGAAELGLTYADDPRQRAIDERLFGQKRELAQIDASGRGLGGLLGGGANTSAPRGTARPASEQEIRAYVLENGGNENDVLDTMAQYKAAGLLR